MKLSPASRKTYFGSIVEEVSESTVIRSTFLFTLAFGFFVHFFILSSYLFNHDSITLLYTNFGWLLTQGKWFVTPLNDYKGPLILSYLSGAVGIVVIAVISALLCLIFSVKKKGTGWMIGAMLVAFPSVATILMYRACDYFALSVLLAVLAVFFAKRRGIVSALLGIVFLTLSIGSYQGYLGFTAAIFVLLCILDLLRPDVSWKQVLVRGLAYIAEIVVSAEIYYGILQLRLYQAGTELSTYKGINEMSDNLTPARLWNSVVVALKNAYGFFLQDNLGGASIKMRWIYTLLLVTILILAGIAVRRHQLYRDIVRCILLVILIVLALPLACNAIGVFSNNTSYYYITIYPICLIFISIPLLLETCLPERSNAIGSIIHCGALLLSVICVFSWFIRDNQGYEKLFYENYAIQSKSTILVAQIQEIEGYNSEMPVALVGRTPYGFLASQGISAEFDNIDTSAMGFGSASDEIYAEHVLRYVITSHIAPNMKIISEADISDAARGAAESMPIYPNSGSIQMADGYILVKLGETE